MQPEWISPEKANREIQIQGLFLARIPASISVWQKEL